MIFATASWFREFIWISLGVLVAFILVDKWFVQPPSFWSPNRDVIINDTYWSNPAWLVYLVLSASIMFPVVLIRNWATGFKNFYLNRITFFCAVILVLFISYVVYLLYFFN